jgi:hypothetical protein
LLLVCATCALALIAYLPALQLGFLADDYDLLHDASTRPLAASLVPGSTEIFYRPVGKVFTWWVGWQLWGYNPFPFHLESVLLHAAASIALALWLAQTTGNRMAGMLAGLLFVVFPAHLEAVAWVADQWDVLATLLLFLSLWLFVKWWAGRNGPLLYCCAVALYVLSIFSKESTVFLLPVFALSIWAAKRLHNRRDLHLLMAAMVPFALAAGLNVSIRLWVWGTLGGYGNRRELSITTIMDVLAGQLRPLLAPLSPQSFDPGLIFSVQAITALALLVGLVRYYKRDLHLLALLGAWLLFASIQQIALDFPQVAFQFSRYLYIVVPAYCGVLAVLLSHAWNDIRPGEKRYAALSLVVLLFGAVAVNWTHLATWHLASDQVRDIERDLRRVMPTSIDRASGATLYVEDVPSQSHGIFILQTAIGSMWYFNSGQNVTVRAVDDLLTTVPPSGDRHAYGLQFMPSGNDYKLDCYQWQGQWQACR